MTELDDLRSAVRAFLEKQAPVRTDDPAVWTRLTSELGLLGLVGEDDALALVATVVEETGRVLLNAPYLSTIVGAFAVPTLEITDGSVALALTGDLSQVPHAATASMLLVAVGDDLQLVEDFTAEPVEVLDVTRPCARVTAQPGRVVGSAAAARDLEAVALAAECVGAAQRLLEMTVEHLLTREQFGLPLGSFQALRHRVADLTVLVEAARSSVWYAAQGNELPVSAPLALATASDAFTAVAGEAVQLHGGIGFTWEHDVHLYFKRAWSTALLHDSRALRRLAFERAGR
ncbi:MAG: acdA 2 [Frankiales bacterium]|nr:acdA 2 [Frankiales bacterium]